MNKKVVFYLISGWLGLWAITEMEKQCIEDKRKQLNEKIEECRKRFSDPKDVSICAQDAKQQFMQQVKSCYERKE